MTASIKFLRFQYSFGRHIAYAQLVDDNTGRVIVDSTLANILLTAQKEGVTVSNAQDMLVTLICQHGLAS